jgi:hypothetical protein
MLCLTSLWLADISSFYMKRSASTSFYMKRSASTNKFENQYWSTSTGGHSSSKKLSIDSEIMHLWL